MTADLRPVDRIVPAWQQAVDRAVASLAAGRMVVVLDDEDRENEGDLILAAEDATPEAIAFIVRHSTGILCAPMSGARLDALQIPLMTNDNTDAHSTAFTISVDHVSTTTGVSAHDRSATIAALAGEDAVPDEFRRPGHVFPLRAREGGVLKRAGHTEAALDLVRLAGKTDVAVISEIVNDDGSMQRREDLERFALEHQLVIVSIADLVRYRRTTERLVVEAGSAVIPTKHGDFRAVAYTSVLDGVEHMALVKGDIHSFEAHRDGVLVRVHSECLTGDLIGSLRCDCGTQLERSLQAIDEAGCGVVVYLRGHEGRGIGLGHKLRAYRLQDDGFDTVDANLGLGLPVDSREYGVGAQILSDLGVQSIRLITNNPAKYSGLAGYDLEICERVSLGTVVTAQNVAYLRTKRDRMGHELDGPLEVPAASS